jgi:hypothetical protein
MKVREITKKAATLFLTTGLVASPAIANASSGAAVGGVVVVPALALLLLAIAYDHEHRR